MAAFFAFLSGFFFFVAGLIFNYLGFDGEPLYFLPGFLLSFSAGTMIAIGMSELW